MPKRKDVDPVPFHQYILGEMASIIVLVHTRDKQVNRKAGRIAHKLCRVAIPDTHCQSVLESFRLMTTHIGGDKGNKRLTSKERGDFYAARHLLTRQLRRITTCALASSAVPEPAEVAALDMHTNIGEAPLAAAASI